MRLERGGITRLVILTKNYAIKIPNFTCQWNHFLIGLISNINEQKAYKYSEKKELLCPVLWSSWGGWILVMKKAIPCDWEKEIDYSIWIEAGFGEDNKPDNYGYLDGKIVKIDYP